MLKKCHDTTLSYIDWLLKAEYSAFTLNEHYFSDYKDQFLAKYRGVRQRGRNRSLMETLESASNGYAADSPLSKIIGGLGEIGMNAVQTSDISKLLPPDPCEPALHIMAGVRAYFQGIISNPFLLYGRC